MRPTRNLGGFCKTEAAMAATHMAAIKSPTNSKNEAGGQLQEGDGVLAILKAPIAGALDKGGEAPRKIAEKPRGASREEQRDHEKPNGGTDLSRRRAALTLKSFRFSLFGCLFCLVVVLGILSQRPARSPP